MEVQKEIYRRLVQPPGRGRLIAAGAVLFSGTAMLLLSILAWANFSALLNDDRQPGAQQATYMVIGKKIVESRYAGSRGFFTRDEQAALLQAPQVLDAGPVTPAAFPVYATLGSGALAMATELPMAAVPGRFIEKLPGNWTWHPGSGSLPIILPDEFLDIYNYVFAPGQGLPQLSRASVSALGLRLRAGGGAGVTLTGYVAGFSSRVNTLVVPQEFIDYGNASLAAGGASGLPSQLILKVKDPSDASFAAFLGAHGYTTDARNMGWSKMRTLVQAVTSTAGFIALVILAMSALLLALFSEVTIARSNENLRLLWELGYSKRALRRLILLRYTRFSAMAMLPAMLLCCGLQWLFSRAMHGRGLALSAVPGWEFWLALIMCALIIWLVLVRAVRRALG